jgi:hypothetical protein
VAVRDQRRRLGGGGNGGGGRSAEWRGSGGRGRHMTSRRASGERNKAGGNERMSMKAGGDEGRSEREESGQGTREMRDELRPSATSAATLLLGAAETHSWPWPVRLPWSTWSRGAGRVLSAEQLGARRRGLWVDDGKGELGTREAAAATAGFSRTRLWARSRPSKGELRTPFRVPLSWRLDAPSSRSAKRPCSGQLR